MYLRKAEGIFFSCFIKYKDFTSRLRSATFIEPAIKSNLFVFTCSLLGKSRWQLFAQGNATYQRPLPVRVQLGKR